jgi:hypothetical protein
MLECHWKSTLGIECPGCGFQRSVELLFHGDIWGSIQLFPATIPLFVTLLFTVMHLKFKFRKGAKIIIVLFALSAGLMVLNFCMKLV